MNHRVPKWGGRKAQAWTRAVLGRYGTECQLRLPGCTGLATTGDHIKPRSARPDLQYDVTNGRPACLPCNIRRYDGRHDQAVIIDALGLLHDEPPAGTCDPARD